MTTPWTDIQNDAIAKYGITLCDGSLCKNDWRRTHVHTDLRRICKWKQAASVESTVHLFHEIGHCENNTGRERRAEKEFKATCWAIDEFRRRNLRFPLKMLFRYQTYVLLETSRGLRRGGRDYPHMNLYEYAGEEVSLDELKRIFSKEWWCEEEALEIL